MSGGEPPSPEHLPADWDRLFEAPGGDGDEAPAGLQDEGSGAGPPPRMVLLTAAWAELAVMLAPCAASLAALRLADFPASLGVVPWAAGLAAAWWTASAAALVFLRRGTPGMLLAGVRLERPVHGWRLALTLAATAVTTALLGLPALLGSAYWPPALAAGGASAWVEDRLSDRS